MHHHEHPRRPGPRVRAGVRADRFRVFPPGGTDDSMRWIGPPLGRGFGGRARKGDVRHAILSLLAEGPSNGYGLIKAIHERTHGGWRASPGSVYPTLQQLVDEGLVAPVSAGPRPEYELTGDGREYVAAHERELAAAWEGARSPWQENRELFAAANRVMGVVRQVAAEGTPEQRAATVAKLDDLRRELYRMLGE